jgi:hypothetical protein
MKKILLPLLLLVIICSEAQESQVELSLQQDLRLFTVGDGKGNDPITLNLFSKLEVPFRSFSKSHLSTYISAEYADLNMFNYQRYALGVAYIIDKLSGRFGAGAYLDYGKIYREKNGFNSYSLSGELSFKLNNRLKLICTQQLTHRKDLKVLYDTQEYLISGFVGIKYKF